MKKCLLAGMMFFFSGGSMASTLVLPSAESLSGQWLLIDGANSCDIYFSAERFTQINGFKLSISADCARIVLPSVPEAWRPTPDGIALLARDGQIIQFFSREGELYRSQVWEKSGKVLAKKETCGAPDNNKSRNADAL